MCVYIYSIVRGESHNDVFGFVHRFNRIGSLCHMSRPAGHNAAVKNRSEMPSLSSVRKETAARNCGHDIESLLLTRLGTT